MDARGELADVELVPFAVKEMTRDGIVSEDGVERKIDTLIMATHYFDEKENKMKPIPPESSIDARTTFLLLKDAKVIFDGTVEELAGSKDEYIREYFA